MVLHLLVQAIHCSDQETQASPSSRFPGKLVVLVPRPLSRKNSLLLRRGWPFCSIQAFDRLDEAYPHYRRQSAYSVHKFTCYFHPKTSLGKYLELCWNTELWPSQADINKINPRTSAGKNACWTEGRNALLVLRAGGNKAKSLRDIIFN